MRRRLLTREVGCGRYLVQWVALDRARMAAASRKEYGDESTGFCFSELMLAKELRTAGVISGEWMDTAADLI